MSARVLVVDDIPANVKLLEARLSAEYFDVVTAVSGVDALKICERAECDVVLLDVMMPDMDGFEVCKRLKSNPATHHIPVVMVTALDQPSDRVKGLQAGADDFLTKPVSDVALIARGEHAAAMRARGLRIESPDGAVTVKIETVTRPDELAWKDGDAVLPWLLRVARNEVIDHRRKRTRRSALLARFFGGSGEIDTGADVEGAVVRRDELDRALVAMQHLSERDRTLIGLRIAADLPFAEIGAVVGLSEHAATVATKRALQRLRRRLEVRS